MNSIPLLLFASILYLIFYLFLQYMNSKINLWF